MPSTSGSEGQANTGGGYGTSYVLGYHTAYRSTTAATTGPFMPIGPTLNSTTSYVCLRSARGCTVRLFLNE